MQQVIVALYVLVAFVFIAGFKVTGRLDRIRKDIGAIRAAVDDLTAYAQELADK